MALCVGGRERAIFSRSLTPLLIGLVNKGIVIELKTGICIYGKITSVDCFMNLTMEHVQLRKPNGEKSYFEFFFLQRKSIRGIRIPNQVPIERLLKDGVAIVSGAKRNEENKRNREKRAHYLMKKSKKRMTL